MATAYFLAQQQQHPSQQLAAAHMPLPPTHLAAAAAPHVASAARPRRTARLVTPNPAPRQFRGVKSMRELVEPPSVAAFRARFEAGRSFDLDDDLEFCPSLLTDDDIQTLYSSGSERSSLASGSPDSSPLQHQIQPAQQVAPTISLSPVDYSYATPFASAGTPKFHQPSAVRSRNPIAIINPKTGMRVTSPPATMSPAMVQMDQRRW